MRILLLLGMVCFLCVVLSCKKDAKAKESMNVEMYRSIIDHPVENMADLARFFPKTEDEIKQYADASMRLAHQELETILSIKDQERTFDNTARALDQSQSIFSRTMNMVQVLHMTHPDKKIREAAQNAFVSLHQFSVDLYMNPALYQAFKVYLDINGRTESLNDEERYFLEEAMKGFERDGLNLPDDKLQEVKLIKKEIAQLTTEFEKNIASDKSEIKVSLSDLDGADEHFIKSLARDGELYILRCDYPTSNEIMNNCRVGKTRKDFYLAINNRAYPANVQVLGKIIALRDELAKKLGFESFAALNLDSEMAKRPDRVDSFLSDLLDKSNKKVEQEFDLLRQNLPAGVELDDQGKMYAWDYSYTKSAYKKKMFNVDERELAEYFPVDKALDGMLGIYQNFLGLEFKVITPAWKWHDEVQLIEIHDKATGRLRGYLFLDLYPRDDKYSHACYAPLIVPQLRKNIVTGVVENIPSVGVMIANFPRASGGRPALFKHADVETFFHEFGHAMHGYFGRTELASCAGVATKTDFVELPSQMFEEWMTDKNTLKLVGSHYKTGAPIPDELIDKKIALKKFDSGYFIQGQAVLALFSLNVYKEGAQKDTDALVKELRERYVKNIRFEPQTHFQASFGHLTEYGARYYGYLWSKVFALDIFYEIKNQSLKRSIGKKFAETVLSKGGSVDPNQILVDFLGREPQSDAFMEDAGLIE